MGCAKISLIRKTYRKQTVASFFFIYLQMTLQSHYHFVSHDSLSKCIKSACEIINMLDSVEKQ